MSESAPEAPARGRGRENVFTRRIGPLPMWQWLVIGVGLVGVYALYEYRKNASAAASSTNQAAGTSTGGTTGAAQVPQFVNQTYTYVAPPVVQAPPPAKVPGTPAPKPDDDDKKTKPSGGGGGGGGGAPKALNAQTYGGPNLIGLTAAQAKQQLAGTKWHINTDTTGGATIVSFTPYSNQSINIG